MKIKFYLDIKGGKVKVRNVYGVKIKERFLWFWEVGSFFFRNMYIR